MVQEFHFVYCWLIETRTGLVHTYFWCFESVKDVKAVIANVKQQLADRRNPLSKEPAKDVIKSLKKMLREAKKGS